MRKIFLAFFIFHFSLFICHAADFGVLVDMHAEAENNIEKTDFEFRTDIMPRLSFLFGDSSSLFLSGGLTLAVKGEEFIVIPELLQTEFVYRPGNWEIRAGRIFYTDPLGFITSGLFDGALFSINSMGGIFNAGAWYTGTLYKKSAVITMTGEEQVSFDATVDYVDHPLNTYFAPKRLLASIGWEHPSLGELLHLKASVTAQADLNGKAEKYNSQYFTLKAGFPVEYFIIELGGSLETVQSGKDLEDSNIAFALDLGVFWMLPSSFNSRLSFTGRFASGNTDGITNAFVPVTGIFHGSILRAKISGITVLGLDYSARFADPFGMSLTVSHFVRNDLGTYMEWPVDITDNTGHFLGTEFYARLVWSPISDLQLKLGGGVFLPVLGDVNPDEKTRWRVELTVTFAVY
jgi:hypothetical protein